MYKKIRVLVVDDSSLVRDVFRDGLTCEEIEVVDTAEDAFQARDKIVQHQPDVLTLDVEMPKMNGLDFLKQLMPQRPLPVVMVSAFTEKGKRLAMESLEAGAVDIVTKPSKDSDSEMAVLIDELKDKIRTAASVDVSHWKFKTHLTEKRLAASKALDLAARKVIAIGASTGGTEAIRAVVNRLPANTPGVVMVIHMPEGFTSMYADRLNQVCAMTVKEAKSGDTVRQGQILLAPGGYQMTVNKTRTDFQVTCVKAEKVSGHCPSVDVLMHSVARSVGPNSIGILLTGMGKDGAEGLLAMRQAGARTMAQDEATSVVFGMPRVAHEIGASERLLPLDHIAPETLELLTGIHA